MLYLKKGEYVIFCHAPGAAEIVGRVSGDVFMKGAVHRIEKPRALQFSNAPAEVEGAPPKVMLTMVFNPTNPDYWDVNFHNVFYVFPANDHIVSAYVQATTGLLIAGQQARPAAAANDSPVEH